MFDSPYVVCTVALYSNDMFLLLLVDRVNVGGDLSALLGEEYKAVVKQNACITLQISKCTTIGPPRVGKTCLKYLLIGQKWDRDEGTVSTDAMEAPEWVEVFHGDEDSTWTRLDRETRKDNLINDMALQNYDLKKTGGDVKKTGGDLKKTGGDVEETGRDVEKIADVRKNGGDVEKTVWSAKKTGGDVKTTVNDIDVENTVHIHFDSNEIKELQSTYLMEFFEQKLEKAKREPKKVMKTRKFLHFIDTGGQRIYHDVHPVLITSPSVYLVVINLVDCAREHGILLKHPKELEDINPIAYNKREPISSSKQSSMTSKLEDLATKEPQPSFLSKDPEAMNLAERALRSIQTFTSKQYKEGEYFKIQPKRPKVFIVGTHLDEICPNDSEGRQRVLEELHQIMKGRFKGKPYSRFIQYDDKFRCFWAVDNTLAGDEKLQERDPKMYEYLRLLRSLIQEQSMMFNVKIPVKWQIFEHLTSHQSHFQYKELLDFALDKKFVENQGEFTSLLKVFHILGLYFFRIPHLYTETSLRDNTIIFTKPDVLYKATTELLKSAKLAGDKIVDVKSHLDWLMLSEKIANVNVDWFISLLSDLRLMAAGKSPHQFIIPAALPARVENTEESDSNYSVGSLLVTFLSPQSRESFIPSGLFCALVSEVLTFPEFKPKPGCMYRDCVVLTVSELHLTCGDLYIMDRDVYIKIAFKTTTKDGLRTLANLSRKCIIIRNFIHSRINIVWRKIYEEQVGSEISEDLLNFPKDMKAITWGFPCLGHPHGAHLSEYQEDEMGFCARCLECKSSYIQDVRRSQQVWFQNLTGEVNSPY